MQALNQYQSLLNAVSSPSAISHVSSTALRLTLSYILARLYLRRLIYYLTLGIIIKSVVTLMSSTNSTISVNDSPKHSTESNSKPSLQHPTGVKRSIIPFTNIMTPTPKGSLAFLLQKHSPTIASSVVEIVNAYANLGSAISTFIIDSWPLVSNSVVHSTRFQHPIQQLQQIVTREQSLSSLKHDIPSPLVSKL
jgi:hypothetical protein